MSGSLSATFTEEERAKLGNYATIDNPAKFTESMYFLFLVCEAKCRKKNSNNADVFQLRQVCLYNANLKERGKARVGTSIYYNGIVKRKA